MPLFLYEWGDMGVKTTRKCRLCGKEFNIVTNDYIRYRNGYCEIQCYKDYKVSKGVNRKTLEHDIKILLEITKEEKRIMSEQELDKTKKRINAKKNEMDRKENLKKLIEYFSYEYNIVVFPKYFYSKLAQINNGIYKGLVKGIPYNDMLDMFKIQQPYLNKIFQKNISQGKDISDIGRLNYDIAVIINKYDKYLNWKNKQKVLEQQVLCQDVDERSNINYSKLCKHYKENNSNNEISINDIIDEIY